jgi:hypothetical protein
VYKEWKQFAKSCHLDASKDDDKINAREALQGLVDALSKPHVSKTDFVEKLFLALRKAIGENNIDTEYSNSHRIVLKGRKVGFERQNNHDDDEEMTIKTRTYHSCVVY